MRKILTTAILSVSAAAAWSQERAIPLEGVRPIPSMSLAAAPAGLGTAQALTPIPIFAAPSAAITAFEIISPMAAPAAQPVDVAPVAAKAPFQSAESPRFSSVGSIEHSGIVAVSNEEHGTAAAQTASNHFFDLSAAHEDSASVLAFKIDSRSSLRRFLGKVAATASAVMAVPALAAAQTHPVIRDDGSRVASAFLVAFTAGAVVYTIAHDLYKEWVESRPARIAAKAYAAKNAAAILAIPGVTKVAAETVATSPYSSGPGVVVYYELGADRKAIAAALPPGDVDVNVLPSYSQRNASRDYVRRFGDKIRAIPGVTKVAAETVATSPYSAGPGVGVYYGLDADRKAIGAALPSGDVDVNVMPGYSQKEAARDYVRRFGDKIRAIPGVEKVTIKTMEPHAYDVRPTVAVTPAAGADISRIEALLPSSLNDVAVVVQR